MGRIYKDTGQFKWPILNRSEKDRIHHRPNMTAVNAINRMPARIQPEPSRHRHQIHRRVNRSRRLERGCTSIRSWRCARAAANGRRIPAGTWTADSFAWPVRCGGGDHATLTDVGAYRRNYLPTRYWPVWNGIVQTSNESLNQERDS